jgi:hypothetical protein
MTLQVNPEPCFSCPYRKDVPSGVWHTEEYEKLRKYDEPPIGEMPALEIFLCHQTKVAGQEIVCKGWCMVHIDSIAVRLAQLQGQLFPEAFTPTKAELHASGNAAADFGEKDIKRPKANAVKVSEKLRRTGKFKN